MTDRKVTCVACKSAVTKGDIDNSDLEFGGAIKATNQPEYTADADTDLVATVGTLDEYTPMVRTTGTQEITGLKCFKTTPRIFIDAPKNSTVRKAKAFLSVLDNNGEGLLDLFYVNVGDGTAQLEARMSRIDGTYATVVLLQVTL